MADTREIDLLERIAACNAEWGESVVVDDATPTPTSKTVTAYRLPPAAIKTSELPLIYALPPSYEERDLAAGLDESIYTISLYVLVTPMTNRKIDDDGIIQAMSWVAYLQMAARVYFDQHRQLDTEAAPYDTLDFVTDDIRLRFGTVGEIGTPYGAYIGFVLTLTVRTI